MAKKPEKTEPADAVDDPEASAPAAEPTVWYFADATTSVIAKSQSEFDAYKLAGWRHIEKPEHDEILARQEQDRRDQMEAAREAARQAAIQKAQDDAAQQPPEGNALDGLDNMPSKTLEERTSRIEFILRGMGYPV